MDHQTLFAIMSGKDRRAKAHLMRAGLSCAEPFYRLATGVRNKLFDWGIRKATKLPRPVISVGNITTGGTGKTPMVIALARKLLAMGEKPAVLLRGYRPPTTTVDIDFESGTTEKERQIALAEIATRLAAEGRDDSSDEAKVLRRDLPASIAVVEGASRIDAATEVISSHPETSIFILDDAFQHRMVARQLDIVLIDATQPFGFGHVLPRGLLREGLRNLHRADAIVLTRCDLVEDDALRQIDHRIKEITSRPPTAHATGHWSQLRDENDSQIELSTINGKRVLGVAGIGNPNAFGHMLAEHCQLVELISFKDHSAYEARDLVRAADRAMKSSCNAIVTTEKDWVKWREIWPQLETSIPVYRPILDIQFTDGEDAFDELIRERVLNKSV